MVGMFVDCAENGKLERYTTITYETDDYHMAVNAVYQWLHEQGRKVIHITVVKGDYKTIGELEEIIEKNIVIPDGFICFPYQEVEGIGNEER